MRRLERKSIIITGAGSGIGRAAALLFASEGASVVAVDVFDGVESTVEQVRNAGGIAEFVIADAGLESDVQGFIARAVSSYGSLMRSGPMLALAADWCRSPNRRPSIGRKFCASI